MNRLYLRRPPAENEEWRVDRLLKRKAEQGVRIYICVYKEVVQSTTIRWVFKLKSKHSKRVPANAVAHHLVRRIQSTS